MMSPGAEIGIWAILDADADAVEASMDNSITSETGRLRLEEGIGVTILVG